VHIDEHVLTCSRGVDDNDLADVIESLVNADLRTFRGIGTFRSTTTSFWSSTMNCTWVFISGKCGS
jgi:hypothetical protein